MAILSVSDDAVDKFLQAEKAYPIATYGDLECNLEEHVGFYGDPRSMAEDCRREFDKIVAATEPSLRVCINDIMWSLLLLPENEHARRMHAVPEMPRNVYEIVRNPVKKHVFMRMLCVVAASLHTRPEAFFRSAASLRGMVKRHSDVVPHLQLAFSEARMFHPAFARDLQALFVAANLGPTARFHKRLLYCDPGSGMSNEYRVQMLLRRAHRSAEVPKDFAVLLGAMYKNRLLPEEFPPFPDKARDDLIRVACGLPRREDLPEPRRTLRPRKRKCLDSDDDEPELKRSCVRE